MDYNKVYTKPHGSGVNGNGKTIIINKGNKQNGFDPQYVNVVNLDAHNANITNLTATNANIDNAEFVYIMSANGVIKKLEGDEIRYKDGVIDALSSSEIATNKLTVKDEANITKLIADYIQSTNITTDYLTVNKSAHFFELIIDKIRSVQGTQMNTAANCIADYVEAYAGIYHDNRDSKVSLTSNNVDYFRIYWKNADNDGRAITNDWLVNDQAICESFNVHPGVTYDTQNKYYWRLVEATDNGHPVYINFDTEEISTTAPQDYEILFVNGFSYGDDEDPTDNYTDFVIHSQIGHYVDGQWVDDEWDNNTCEFTPSSTLYGLQLTLATNGDTLKGGKLIFETDIQTKLNVGVYYDDNTYEYFPTDVYKYSYVIETSSDKCVEAIVINTAIIDKWDACNWIDLSNVTCDTGVSGKSAIPTIGDNICQLGYRYNNLANPTQDDIARASAIIIAAYNTPDSGVKPPSYAQYQNITDFSLTTHRGSYFDATGAYFKGNLVAGTTIDPGVNIPVVVDNWDILADSNIITKDQNNLISPQTINLTLLYNNGVSSQLVTTLPAGKAIYVEGILNTNGLVIDVNDYVSVAQFNNIAIELKDTANTQTFAGLTINAIDVNAANGRNGSFIQFIYKNWDPTQGALPTPQDDAQHSYPPDGWSTSGTTPLVDEYTYMSQRTVSYDSSNNPVYSAWTTPIRISGTDGEMGADGDGIEFIYHRTMDDTPPELFKSYVDIPNPSSLDMGTIEFVIRPGDPGYDTDTNYIRIWEDGYGTRHGVNSSDYLPPEEQAGANLYTHWTDEPQGVTDIYLYEWIAVRQYDGQSHEWSQFSDPVIWAKYGQNGADGSDGQDGQDGQDGDDGESWVLVPIKNDFSVRLNNASNYSSIFGKINVDLAFGVQHIVGDVIEWVNATELANYSLNLITDNTVVQNTQTGIRNIENIQINGTTIPVITYQNNNYLEYTANTSAGNYINYYYLHSHGLTTRMPTRMIVELVNNNVKLNSWTKELIFYPDHVFSVTDDALNSVFQGLSGDPSGDFTTGFSVIKQQWDSINLAVNNNEKFQNGEFPVANEYEQYAYYRRTVNTAPFKPSGDVSTNTEVNDQWTTYNLEANSTYKYVFYSKRTKPTDSLTHATDVWSVWSEPKLIQVYGTNRGYANNAALQITADGIQSTVSRTYLTQTDASNTYLTQVDADNTYLTQSDAQANYVEQSQISQLADEIELSVTQSIGDEILNNTGIDITNGRITLNADNTIITGTNLLLNQDQGILIKDSDDFNNIIISSKDITDFNVLDRTDVVGGTFRTNSNYFDGVNNHAKTFALSQTDIQIFDIGNLPVGSVIKLNSVPSFRVVDRDYTPYSGNYVAIYDWDNKYLTINLRRDGTVIQTAVVNGKTLSGTALPHAQVSNNIYYSGGINYTVDATGHTYDFTVTITDSEPLNPAWSGTIWYEVTMNVSIKAVKNSSINIGTNGMNIIALPMHGYVNNSTFVIEDTTTPNVAYGSTRTTGLKVDKLAETPYQLANGKKSSTGGGYETAKAWVTVGNIVQVVDKANSTGDTIDNFNDFYLYSQAPIYGSTHNININNISSGLVRGRHIWIKSTNGACVVNSGGSAIIYDVGATSPTNSLNIGNNMAEFICGGDYWFRVK